MDSIQKLAPREIVMLRTSSSPREAEIRLLKLAEEVKEGKKANGEGAGCIQHLFSEISADKSLAMAAVNYPEILKLADKNCRTVAHVVASHREAALLLLNQMDILKLSDKNRSTVASEISRHPEVVLQMIQHPEITKDFPASLNWYIFDDVLSDPRVVAALKSRHRRLAKKVIASANSLKTDGKKAENHL